MKNFLILPFLLISLMLQAQTQTFKILPAYSFLTTGDGNAASFGNEYQYKWNSGIFLSGSLGFTLGLYEGGYTYKENSTVIVRGGNYQYFRNLNEELLETGWIINSGKPEKSIYLYTGIDVGYDFLKSSKHNFSVALGPRLLYADFSYQTEAISGYFDADLLEDREITLVNTIHHNYYDYGLAISLAYDYSLTERVQVGVKCSGNQFFNSGDGIYSAGLSFGFMF